MAEPGQPSAAPATGSSSLAAAKIAVLGAGRLGEALIAGLMASGMVARENLVATAAHAGRLDALAGRFGIRTTLENVRAVEGADLILLSVKPQTVAEVLAEIQGVLREEQLLVSTAASVSTAYIENLIGRPVPVVRSMPNTPCLLRQGMTALSPGRYARKEDLELAGQVFGCLGRTMVLEEKHMDAVTGLSASGPAYIYMVIESLAQGGVKVGLPRDVATLLAAQTVRGAAAMVLETGEHPARLTDMVTTPAGCTIDGILELEEGGLRVTLIKAVVRATQRARELLHT
jgi:pyrroline-5-carboxylate reductase